MSFPFDPHGHLIVVPARIHGRDSREIVDLVLDTGATRTIVSREVAQSLGYDPATLGQWARITTGSGALSVPLLRVAKIEALGKTATNLRILCHSLPSRAAIDGVLGLDFLRGERLVIDFRAGLLALE
ncbi:MAG: retropepsin-like aspartic protease [Chloroflexi bacterium]|nr:retropepsin-like aspartic protease [Chloroflexota bacterium]